ncbi:hypothetical protein [Emticicia sp. BO119]|uniref:hypothetical protein n=1 Tax=Emticicia sp. BO119 TaxID=2757768 RepID=UPI0015EFF5C6|nr:hypothetical protein [Emticicia sp. BO119]MBA4851482.1 hypothetical protein [Emticicia sp. BO119]
METINLWSLFNPLESFLEKSILSSKYWKVRVVLFSCLFSFAWLFVFNRGYIYENFRSFYADVLLHNPQPFFFWNSIIAQGEAPLVSHQYESGSHEANRIFRLTIPLIAHYFHLNSLGLYLLQVILGVGFLYLLVNLLAKIFDDKLLTFYLFFAFVNVYVGSCFFFNCFGHGDGYTFFFMLCALIIRQPMIMTLFCQLAFWCDERSVLMAIGLWLFHHCYYHLRKKDSIKALALVATNVLLYLVIRVYLSNTYHLASEDVEHFSLDRYIYFIKFTSLWYGKRSSVSVEGFALVIMMVFIILYRDKQYLKILLALGSWLPMVAVSFLVGDTVRTLSFTFIFWLISLIIIKERINSVQLKALVIVIAFINLLIPVSFP